MVRRRFINLAEAAQITLAWVVAGCAAAIIVAGFFAKSTRWTDSSGGRSMAWADGIKLWAVWAVLGSLAVLLLLILSVWTERWIPTGAAIAAIFWRVASIAASYRSHLESAGWESIYDHQRLALGLRIVPFIAVVGMLSAALLTSVATWIGWQNRRSSLSPRRT